MDIGAVQSPGDAGASSVVCWNCGELGHRAARCKAKAKAKAPGPRPKGGGSDGARAPPPLHRGAGPKGSGKAAAKTGPKGKAASLGLVQSGDAAGDADEEWPGDAPGSGEDIQCLFHLGALGAELTLPGGPLPRRFELTPPRPGAGSPIRVDDPLGWWYVFGRKVLLSVRDSPISPPGNQG